ncbi:hypothetical protein H6G00_01900 [Leptolyngbya sp. FACHB-541]|uniref:hypothetical protein n=1 Tax=Leptolyngbya sp. FACHB-541 TaxID=2692810 RepID=UPI001688DD3F|nr:hypothetical protein [Leptolyngbya sp. FACHB-541]MBD1995385.1 hypothetical protein [Leptolyngbya sp. FACHB-541]
MIRKVDLIKPADELGIVKNNALQEWAAREAIETLSFMWAEWAVTLSEEEFKGDVQQVISHLETWRDAVLQQGVIQKHPQGD